MRTLERTVDTAERQKTGHDSAQRLSLVVFFGDGVHSFPLPEAGDVVVGRSREADLHVTDESLSRKHASLKVEAGRVQVKDLQSQNGTRVNNARIGAEWVALEPGDALQLGDATAVLQRSAHARHHRRLWSHGYFEARLDEECASGKGSFAVVRVHVEGRAKEATVAETLSRTLKSGDCLASYAPGELEALLLDVTEAEANERADGLVYSLEPLGVAARTGLAWSPRDGRDPERLLALACAAVFDREPAAEAPATGFIIASPAMKRLYEVLSKVAGTDVSVLVLGETGSGKEVVARALHDRSPRAKHPYVALNCAAFSENLLESELFGHEKGAFTGATEAHAGLLEAAEGGTVFLDEVGELPQQTQAKLLRVLEDRSVRRVGGTKTRTIDVRFVAATNRDLETEVKQKRFREDLYFRIAAMTVAVPPLRERKEELEPLAKAFLALSKRKLTLSDASWKHLSAYAWPGNVRELRNVIERAALLAEGKVIEPDQLPLEKLGALWLDATPLEPPPTPAPPKGGEHAERQRIVAALAASAGNQTQAARRLGISRRTLIYRLDEYGLPRPQKKAT